MIRFDARLAFVVALGSIIVVFLAVGARHPAVARAQRLDPDSAGKITEYAVPTAHSKPWSITAGPDGALWFSENGANKIGRITTAGQFTEYVVPRARAGKFGGITTGPDGALWFAEYNLNAIGRITTTGAITQYDVPGSSGPSNIVTGPDGALWFTELGGYIGRIATDGGVSQYPIPTSSFGFATAQGITSGPDGALWFTGNRIYSDPVDNYAIVGRATTTGQIGQFPVPRSVNETPDGITTGPDGAMWFTLQAPHSKIGRVTTGTPTHFTAYRIPGPSPAPGSIAPGPDGALWFTEVTGNTIGRITTTGQLTEYPLPASGAGPGGIAAGPDGAMWFTEVYAGKIGRITTGRRLAPRN